MLGVFQKKFDSITDYLLYLKINFKIIVITESWLTTSNTYLFNIPNYSSEDILRKSVEVEFPFLLIIN